MAKKRRPTAAQFRELSDHPRKGPIQMINLLKFRDRADLRNELSRLEADNGPDWPVDDPERVRLNSRIKSAQHSGGDYLAYGVTALLMGMLDSYVSAHLYNFGRHFAVSESGRGQLAIRICF